MAAWGQPACLAPPLQRWTRSATCTSPTTATTACWNTTRYGTGWRCRWWSGSVAPTDHARQDLSQKPTGGRLDDPPEARGCQTGGPVRTRRCQIRRHGRNHPRRPYAGAAPDTLAIRKRRGTKYPLQRDVGEGLCERHRTDCHSAAPGTLGAYVGSLVRTRRGTSTRVTYIFLPHLKYSKR